MHAKSSKSGNGLNGTVPNGSKVPDLGQQVSANDRQYGQMGRPAVLNDEQLLELATKLNQQLGRPPKIDELIDAAGGCQRQRASRMVRALRGELAAKAVRSMLVLPTDLEAEHKAWIDRWMNLAAERLSAIHAQLVERHDQQMTESNDLVAEQTVVIQGLRASLSDQQRIAAELAQSVTALNAAIIELRGERDVARALAEDRLKYRQSPR